MERFKDHPTLKLKGQQQQHHHQQQPEQAMEPGIDQGQSAPGASTNEGKTSTASGQVGRA